MSELERIKRKIERAERNPYATDTPSGQELADWKWLVARVEELEEQIASAWSRTLATVKETES